MGYIVEYGKNKETMVLETTANKRFLCLNYTILIVGREPKGREMLYDLLHGYGVSVDEADSIYMADKLMEKYTYDMIFVDGGIGQEDGIAAAERFLERGDKCMILFTDSNDREECEKYLNAGYRGVVCAPVDKDVINGVLSHWIAEDRKQYLDEADVRAGQSDAEIIRMFMSGINVVGGMELNGNVEDYLGLLEIFYLDGKKRIDSLNERLLHEDFENYTIEVHGSKSAAANIGAMELSEKCRQHEAAGKAADYSYIETHKKELFDCYADILAEIERVLRLMEYGQFAQKAQGAGDMPAIETPEIKAKLEQALGQLEDFHSKECAKSVEELLGFDLPENVRTGLEHVQELLHMYEDDQAEEALRGIIEKL